MRLVDDETPEPTSPPPALVQLTPLEARVLGCLIEKQATTPEVYPLTLNAAQLACNQKSNREPVMNAELGAVGQALRTLEDKQLVRVAHGARSQRYEHTADAALNLTARSRAIVALLLLRGPQTQNELQTRSERLADFPDAAMIGDTLERLAAREPPLVINVGRAAGQREDRYMHLMSGPVSVESLPPARVRSSESPDRYAELEARIEALESAVAELRQNLAVRN